MSRYPLSFEGKNREKILQKIQELKKQDAQWKEGKAFCLVFDGGDDVSELAKKVSSEFLCDNALNPTAFPSLKRFENEVIQMMAGFFNSPDSVSGSLTSGGTESLLMAVKSAREWGKKVKGIKKPEMIMPVTAHPGLTKGAYYFGVKLHTVPVDPVTFKVDIAAMKKKINKNTVLLVGSAANYSQGVVDPIEEIAQLAQKHKTLCHVDGCIGGLVLSWWRSLGHEIPPFDFAIPGVTSISVDLHKYGFCPKGASVLLYRNSDLRKYQFFVETNWPGGIYISPSVTGTRSGGPIAAAWAVMNYLGVEGYLERAKKIKQATDLYIKRIQETPGVDLVVIPDMSILAIKSDQHDIYSIADELSARGWHFDRHLSPESLHLTIMPNHLDVVDLFFKDLEESIEACQKTVPNTKRVKFKFIKGMANLLPKGLLSKMAQKKSGNMGDQKGSQKMAPIYGMMSTLSGKGTLDEVCKDALDDLFTFKNDGIWEKDQEKDTFKDSGPSV